MLDKNVLRHVSWLTLSLELFNESLVELIETEGLDVVVLVHKLDARGNLVDHLFLLVIFSCEKALQHLSTHLLSLFTGPVLGFGH